MESAVQFMSLRSEMTFEIFCHLNFAELKRIRLVCKKVLEDTEKTIARLEGLSINSTPFWHSFSVVSWMHLDLNKPVSVIYAEKLRTITVFLGNFKKKFCDYKFESQIPCLQFLELKKLLEEKREYYPWIITQLYQLLDNIDLQRSLAGIVLNFKVPDSWLWIALEHCNFEFIEWVISKNPHYEECSLLQAVILNCDEKIVGLIKTEYGNQISESELELCRQLKSALDSTFSEDGDF